MKTEKDQRGFWYGKRVLITGVNGFIGGNLARKLLEEKAQVYGLIRNAKRDTYLYFERLADKVTLIEGDLCNKELMTRIISEELIDSVFHLAAQVEIGVGLANPYLTFETNVRGTYSLMEAIRLCPQNIKSVVVASTDKAYGAYPANKMPYKENYPLLPKYPYDTSKACADMIAQTYASDVYGLPVVVTRFCNIYGEGQLNFSAVMPDAITSAQGYSKFIPRGDGSQIRDFIYVGDVVSLYLKIGEALATNPSKLAGEVFNAGTNIPTSIRDVVEMIYQIAGNTLDLEEVLRLMQGKQTRGEIDQQYMDFEKVKLHFGWQPEHSLEAGVKKTMSWFARFNEERFRD